jgi:hypothetical protein
MPRPPRLWQVRDKFPRSALAGGLSEQRTRPTRQTNWPQSRFEVCLRGGFKALEVDASITEQLADWMEARGWSIGLNKHHRRRHSFLMSNSIGSIKRFAAAWYGSGWLPDSATSMGASHFRRPHQDWRVTDRGAIVWTRLTLRENRNASDGPQVRIECSAARR